MRAERATAVSVRRPHGSWRPIGTAPWQSPEPPLFSAVALNLIRLDAWWNGHPLDHTRVSHLARLDLSLTT